MDMSIGVRDGGAVGGSCPPQKITKSKSRANVQHKSGEEWEIKKSKSQKAPSLLGKQRQSGNIRFTVGQYWRHYYEKNWDRQIIVAYPCKCYSIHSHNSSSSSDVSTGTCLMNVPLVFV